MLSVEEKTGRVKTGGPQASPTTRLSTSQLSNTQLSSARLSNGAFVSGPAVKNGAVGAVLTTHAGVCANGGLTVGVLGATRRSLVGVVSSNLASSVLFSRVDVNRSTAAGECDASIEATPAFADNEDVHAEALHSGVCCDGMGSSARVLVCDDETRLGDLTAGLLQECGFLAGFVPSAVLAKQYLEQHQDTQVLLLDVNLSGSQSTFELLNELAQLPQRPRVVLTSGSAKQDIRAELTHHPLVVGYLEKPYAEEELTATITGAVS